ncbi:E3 ubiquitin-protein ligase RING1-like [Actinidia eriantha]|uniref:E3 ubiquitin-protein ligase RING1-like n=1 Tax=Actinidia eriantha TaxID=165200 RepID=UPI0025897C76|nr:E3 ubiquitin-protein ligase RING1-like [Actinidia eriantha]
MSSTRDSGGGGTQQPQLYFCYECNRTVSITPSHTSSNLLCPNCNGGFLEEYEDPHINPSPTPNNPFFAFSSDPLSSVHGGFPIVFSGGSVGGSEFANPTDISALFGPNRSQTPGEFNPFAFLNNYINTLRAGGANIQFVIENNASDLRLPSNLGDYFIGPGLEQLIQQLAENDPNRYGTPPASKSAVEALPNIKITDQLLASDSSQCAVCKDSFELGEEAKQMPCKHIYHSDCILPWLELHNSCPVCRYELPTDDPDYENRARESPISANLNTGLGSGGGEALQENIQSPRAAERRLRITLPWPFRGFGSPAETSNSGAGNNSGNNNEGSNAGGQAREEDLD